MLLKCTKWRKANRAGLLEISTYRDTGVLTDLEVEVQRREYRSLFGEGFGDALIEQEYLCSFDSAMLGAYWARELAQLERSGRVRELAADANLPVHTAWDLGIGDSTAIFWWQAVGAEIHVLDHHETHGEGLEHYANLVLAKPWRRGSDYVPQDARARELGTGRTRIETMLALGLRPRLVPDHKLMDGINAARLTISRCFFDTFRCKTALDLLRQYRAEYDEKARVFKDNPKHDFTSHTADAFRYLAMAWREMAAVPQSKPEGRTIHEMTLNELFDAERKVRHSIRI